MNPTYNLDLEASAFSKNVDIKFCYTKTIIIYCYMVTYSYQTNRIYGQVKVSNGTCKGTILGQSGDIGEWRYLDVEVE